MTIMDAIERVDTLKPNQYTEEQKVRWLERLDGQLFLELVCTHEGAAGTGRTIRTGSCWCRSRMPMSCTTITCRA